MIEPSGGYLPNAEITFDRFHIIQLANQVVDAVRKAEVRHDARLKRTKWAWLTAWPGRRSAASR